jgi:hypothetical protein
MASINRPSTMAKPWMEKMNNPKSGNPKIMTMQPMLSEMPVTAHVK